jgi:putative hemolysin
MNYATTLLLIFFLIFINAFFAASEIAVISLRRSKLKLLESDKSKQVETVNRLLKNPSQFLATIQIGVTMAGFFASATGAVSLSHNLGRKLEATGLPILGRFGEEIALIAVTLVISYLTLVFGELVPKRIAMSNPEALSIRLAKPLEYLLIAFKPMALILSASTDFISRLFGITHIDHSTHTDEELRIFITEQRTVPIEEKVLINEVFEFGDTMAYEVMTPRTDMVCIEDNSTLKEFLDLSMNSHFSRIPVFRDDLDNILGFVHIKDVLPSLEKLGNDDVKVRQFIRPVHFIPATKKIIELLRELQQKRIHMAIVLDEYGGTAGLVTIEDLLEELVGEIRDEHDQEAPPYRQVSENEYLVDASTPIVDLNELLYLQIPESEEFESIGGLVMEYLGKIPELGEIVDIDHYQIKVERMKGKRIVTLRLMVKNLKEEEDHGETDLSS